MTLDTTILSTVVFLKCYLVFCLQCDYFKDRFAFLMSLLDSTMAVFNWIKEVINGRVPSPPSLPEKRCGFLIQRGSGRPPVLRL